MEEKKIITSASNQHIKDLVALKNVKERNRVGKVLIEGAHLVDEAYKDGILDEVLLVNKNIFYKGVKNTYVTGEIIKKISTTNTPQLILGVALIKQKKIEFGKTILILDGVSDPGNLGTIIRTAKAFEVASIILSNDCVDIYNEKVIRATQGAVFKMPIVKANLIEVIPFLKEQGYKVYATCLKDAIDIEEVKEVSQYALVLGNEANGVSKEVIALCDKALKIKMNQEVESLNVAIAGAICLYSLNQKRK